MQSGLQLFFSLEGRIPRSSYVYGMTLLSLSFLCLFIVFDVLFGPRSNLLLYPLAYWSFLALSIKRYHDIGKKGTRLLLLLIPIVGLLWVSIELFFRSGHREENRFGPKPAIPGLDYLTVPSPGQNLVNDVTGLNPVSVAAVVVPTDVDTVQQALKRFSGPVSIGGGRFSMGGQVASEASLHLDMRGFNKILSLNPVEKTVRVQSGVRWCDLQAALDVHSLSIKIMQTYANFTVGGSLSVNCHGRYMGQGPLILSIRWIKVVLANGDVVEASPDDNSELFYGVIGGYGGLGVVVEVELDLAENKRVERLDKKMLSSNYLEFFKQKVRCRPEAVYHNGDLYPPNFQRVRAITWVETENFVTEPHRLLPLKPDYKAFRYLFWAVSETPFGPWRREYIFEPIFYLASQIHWRNYESGYDVRELEPATRKWKTYVLQEYFVPIDKFDDFLTKMSEIYQRYKVNVVNISIRHAIADPGSLLAWAREEVFAFVVYYKQSVKDHAKNKVGVWTRELIDAVTELGGSWYLPYQAHASLEQFHKGYPRANKFFALKEKLDPEARFRNVLWNKYYPPILEEQKASAPEPITGSEFHAVFSDIRWHDRFYLFLQNIFAIYPPDRFHWLIKRGCRHYSSDEEIYRYIQDKLPRIKPFLSDLFYGLPALKKQKQEMTQQTLKLLEGKRSINGTLEIGTTGRYVSELKKHIQFQGPIKLLHDKAPSMSPVDMIERNQVKVLGDFIPLGNYGPISESYIPSESLDLVTCYVGLHHIPLAFLDGFIDSIHRVLRPGGRFILRDHDVTTPEMETFVSLVHTVFNAGIGESWAFDKAELRHFRSLDEWKELLGKRGFEVSGPTLYQDHDPTLNGLMCFIKASSSPTKTARKEKQS